MPIRPELRHLYRSPEYLAARAEVRIRAGGRCEWCGARNGYYVARNERGRPIHLPPAIAQKERAVGRRIVKIVLTTAHLNHDPAANGLDNLALLCQRCHLGHDRRRHVQNSYRTRAERRGQAYLIPELAARV